MSVSHTSLGFDAVNESRTLPLSSTTASRSSWTAGPGLAPLDVLRAWAANTAADEGI